MLTSGYFAGQLVLSKFRLLLSLHSPPNGKKGTEWVLLNNRCAVRASFTLSGMHTRTPSTVRVEEGGRKVKGVKIL